MPRVMSRHAEPHIAEAFVGGGKNTTTRTTRGSMQRPRARARTNSSVPAERQTSVGVENMSSLATTVI